MDDNHMRHVRVILKNEHNDDSEDTLPKPRLVVDLRELRTYMYDEKLVLSSISEWNHLADKNIWLRPILAFTNYSDETQGRISVMCDMPDKSLDQICCMNHISQTRQLSLWFKIHVLRHVARALQSVHTQGNRPYRVIIPKKCAHFW
jgi:hypothetical protein